MSKLLAFVLFAQLKLDTLPKPKADNTALTSILNIVFSIVGSVTFLIIVIGGLRYIMAAGDSAKMAQAKKTILYALIGLVVVLSAYGIVTLVVKGIGA